MSAQAVHGILLQAWPRRAPPVSVRHTIAQTATVPGTTPALSAVDAVLSGLRASAPAGRIRLSVALADERSHFDVVAGNYRNASERQLRAIASACVAELLGERATGQVVRWQLQPDLRHLLICSIHQEDVDALLAAAANHKLSLASVQPGFCKQWNRHAVALGGGTGVFASADGARTIIACVTDGTITALSCGLLPDGDPDSQEDSTAPGPLDTRVNRLLASIGQDLRSVSRFVLAGTGLTGHRLASHWTRITPQEHAT